MSRSTSIDALAVNVMTDLDAISAAISQHIGPTSAHNPSVARSLLHT
jgi:hypothetical protein